MKDSKGICLFNLHNFQSLIETCLLPLILLPFNPVYQKAIFLLLAYNSKDFLNMNQSTQKQFNDILRQQGIQVGIKPIEDIPNEKCRLDEVERLGVLEKDFSAGSGYNALTQLATITTGTQVGLINILGSNIQRCKMDFGFSADQSAMAQDCQEKFPFANTAF